MIEGVKRDDDLGTTAIATRRSQRGGDTCQDSLMQGQLRQWESASRRPGPYALSWTPQQVGQHWIRSQAGRRSSWWLGPAFSWQDWAACTFRYLEFDIAGNTETWTEQEEGPDAMAVFRVHPNRQELQETEPAPGRACMAGRWTHCPSALKAQGSGFTVWLPALHNSFSPFDFPRIRLLEEKGSFFCAHLKSQWVSTQQLASPELWSKTVLLTSEEALSMPPSESPSQIQCWVQRWVLLSPGLLNTEWIYP